MNHFYSNVYLILALGFIFSCARDASRDSDSSNSAGRSIEYTAILSIENEYGEKLATIDIAIADNDASRSLGLMDVREMKADGGMLFIFDVERRQSFWMANTPLPLDLLFAGKDGRILHIHQNAQPFSRDQIDSVYPAIYVLEVNAGFSMRHDIQVGHHINYTR